MAEDFLRELLQVQNRVQSDEEQKCVICMEDCGTMNQETGLLELAIRLPFCSHIVGSGCIAERLHLNNTCPLCRYTFFPAQPRPWLEHEIIEDQTDLSESDIGESDDVEEENEVTIRDQLGDQSMWRDRCNQLCLDPGVALVAKGIVLKFLDVQPSNAALQDAGLAWFVAVGFYIASRLADDPRSPREITNVIDNVESHQIRDTYDLFYAIRGTLFVGDVQRELDATLGVSLDLESHMWPSPGNEMHDEMIEHDRDMFMITRLAETFCGYFSVSAEVRDLTLYIGVHLVGACCLKPLSSATRKVLIVLVGIYIASHLLLRPITLSRISTEGGIGINRLRTTYRLISNDSKCVEWIEEYPQSMDNGAILSEWPPTESPIVNDEDSSESETDEFSDHPRTASQNSLSSSEADLEELTDICSDECIGLGLSDPVHMLALGIASRVWDITSLRPGSLSPTELAGTCVYMARKVHGISSQLHLSDEMFFIYRVLYPDRERIFEGQWLQHIGPYDYDSALANLPQV